MKRSSIVSALLVFLGLGCSGGGQTGKVTVLLKDAPASFTSAVVTISEVDLVGSGGTTVLTRAEATTDLLTLSNDTFTLLKDVVVPAGTYSQLRFVITGGYVEVGGVVYASSPTYAGLPKGATVGGALQMPSFGQSGLKVDLPGDAATIGTGSKVLLVDFDVSQSFGQDAGASGRWVMHPVVHATDLQLTGEVDVTLALAAGVTLPSPATLADFTAQVTPTGGGEAHSVKFTLTSTGTYVAALQFLDPGTYDLTLVDSSLSFSTTPAVPVTVTVTSGQVTSESFLVTTAAAITAQ
jgi:uncharacterized protein DUF4382